MFPLLRSWRPGGLRGLGTSNRTRELWRLLGFHFLFDGGRRRIGSRGLLGGSRLVGSDRGWSRTTRHREKGAAKQSHRSQGAHGLEY